MRRFIYLDTETLNSYIAQIYDGLIKTNEENTQQINESSKESSYSISPNAAIDFTLLGKGIEGKIEYIFKSLKANKDSTLINKVETKMLHDNAFDLLINHINKHEDLKDGNIGEFIELFNSFFILDFLYYKELFNDANFINFLIDSSMENIIKEIENEKSKLTTGTPNKKQIIKEIDNKLAAFRKEQESEYSNALKLIDIITKIIPYQRVLCINDCIVTLSDEFIRDNIQMSSFKYGGKIKVFGYITNIIHKNTDQNLPIFAEIINKINSAILPEIVNKDEVKIIHPIAIYYE
ncbi:hypothetical protein O3796_08220 [Granulicatella adiacens]|uniref:DUF6414 family protein n=1 Tax=Granulicatella adiacens TaxID=46124 RepID=UPI00352E7ED1